MLSFIVDLAANRNFGRFFDRLMRVGIYSLPAIACLTLAGCGHHRVAGRDCPLKMERIEIPPPGEVAGAALGQAQSDFARALGAALSAQPSVRRSDVPQPSELLVLSGGGQWGAFGAGFIKAWPNRPVFRVVTGVSTGALQGTLALLADQTVDIDRQYPAELDFPKVEPNTGRTYADDLPLAYSVTRSATIYRPHGTLGAVRHGSFGTLEPLRKRLDVLIDVETLRRVADANRSGRKLWVAMLDMDSGAAVAVDMTDLAAKATAQGAPFEAHRQCYLDVLMAAASEPIGAKPVFINGRMYMDAGARYGVFLEEVEKAASASRAQVSVIVNGDLTVHDKTPKPGKKSPDWSFLTVAERAMELVTDQIYDFSVERVIAFGQRTGGVRFARVAPEHEQHIFNGQTCRQARTADIKDEQGKVFQPRFMRCLIDYGAKRDRDQRWNFNFPRQ